MHYTLLRPTFLFMLIIVLATSSEVHYLLFCIFHEHFSHKRKRSGVSNITCNNNKKKKTVKSERKCWILGSYSGDYEQYSHLGCNTVYFSRNSIFWRIISLPPSGLKRVTKIRWKEQVSLAPKIKGIHQSKTLPNSTELHSITT